MIKLGKKSKLGLGMMIAGGAVMTVGALVLKQGRKLDRVELLEEELGCELEVYPTEEETMEENKEVFNMADIDNEIDNEIATSTEDNDIEYNPKADHKAMTQAELEAQSNLGTF